MQQKCKINRCCPPPYFTNSALTSKFNKNCIYYNLATFCFLPNFFTSHSKAALTAFWHQPQHQSQDTPRDPPLLKETLLQGFHQGLFPMHIRTSRSFKTCKKSSSPCLHLLLEAIFQRVFKLPRWRQLAAAACFVLQVLTGGSTPFHKKCTTVLPHLDLEMHEFLKKYLAAVDPKNV